MFVKHKLETLFRLKQQTRKTLLYVVHFMCHPHDLSVKGVDVTQVKWYSKQAT